MLHKIYRLFTASAVLFSMVFSAMAQGKGFDTSRMDKSVEACTDFFQFANGTWIKNTQVPATESRWGTFNILADSNNALLKKVLEESSKANAKKGSDAQLIGDFYSACMDEPGIEKTGTAPIKPFLDEIAAINSGAALVKQVARMHDAGIGAMFNFGAGPDLKDSNAVLINAGQGGLSLPNRDFYTKTDPKSVETREKFVEYVTNMFKLLGDDAGAAQSNAATVMKIQTALAEASLTPVELRNPDNRYNKVTVDAAIAAMPDFSLAEYMSARSVPKVPDMNFAQPKFFGAVNSMAKSVSLGDWKTYLRWMTVNAAAQFLPKAFRDENFNFFGRYLRGQKEQQERWKICVQNTNGDLGEALGMQFVKTAFTPAARKRMNELIDNLMAAMKQRIDGLEWMSDATKKEAQGKLATFQRKIGFPDKPRGYAGLEIDRKSYAGNILRSNVFEIRRNFQDLGKPRDKSRWGFTPSTVNASYNPLNNDITFPAGILQPPFFNFEADDAINYGAIGGVIGHEISHGFDDQGSRFDADGNLKMWWTEGDRAKFDERAACVVKQFDEYEVQPSLFMNGKLTLGENIGDFAGLTIAYEAFKRSMQGKPRPANIDGFTPEQRFFLGWAQVWAAKSTPEAERVQVATDPHALPKWRVNGPLSNMPQFREAFGCKGGSGMVRENSCRIW